MITLERPYRLHDWIRLDETEGQVAAINWRTTHLRTRDNDNLVVPNSEMASAKVLNYYYPHPLHLERIHVGIHYRTPPHRAREALLAAASRVPAVLDKPTPEVYLLEFGDSAITYELRIWIDNVAHQPGIASAVRTAVWEELHRRGLVIPFPIRTLEIEPRAGTLELARARRDEPATGPPTLFLSGGPEGGRTVCMEGDVLRVGRSAECDLVLADVSVSKLHFEIERTGGSYTLRDLGSSHGTRINGRRVQEAALHDMDRIQAGDTDMVFETHG
ncbi:MAG: mechanosensitive ion channel [Thermoanaerobaculia bacterium]